MSRLAVLTLLFFQSLNGLAQSGAFAILPGELEYQFIRNKGKRKPQQGEVCILHMQYFTEQDSVLFDSRDSDEPLQLTMQKPDFTGGIESGIALMGEGDSAIFKVNADSLFEKSFFEDLPPEIEKGSKITYRIGLLKVRTLDELLDEEEKIKKEQREALEKRKNNEATLIRQYLSKNNIDEKPMENGAILINIKRGKGKLPAKGQKVIFLYSAKTLDGVLFDTNIQSEASAAGVEFDDRSFEPLEVSIGGKEVFESLEAALSRISVGGKAKLILPSALTYGSMSVGSLPPYSTLVYELEMLEIK
jgi:FKBP-type peptidyl-prolyl cis-trans isomerase FkpA